jgi:hypothetical protein
VPFPRVLCLLAAHYFASISRWKVRVRGFEPRTRTIARWRTNTVASIRFSKVAIAGRTWATCPIAVPRVGRNVRWRPESLHHALIALVPGAGTARHSGGQPVSVRIPLPVTLGRWQAGASASPASICAGVSAVGLQYPVRRLGMTGRGSGRFLTAVNTGRNKRLGRYCL